MVYEPRSYRRTVEPAGLLTFEVSVGETDLQICAQRDLTDAATRLVLEARAQLESYIRVHPRFAETFVPHAVEPGAPAIIASMSYAGSVAGVGPMAAVAGAVAEHVARGLAEYSSEVIVENGGDVFLVGSVRRTVALYAGPGGPEGVGIEIAPEALPCALATSSGNIGHSLSFGAADAVTVLARDGALADAIATALANRIREPADIEPALALAREVSGVLGVLGTIQGAVGAWGGITLVPVGSNRPRSG